MARLQMYMTVGRVSEVEASITNMVFQHVVTDMPGDKLVTVRPFGIANSNVTKLRN